MRYIEERIKTFYFSILSYFCFSPSPSDSPSSLPCFPVVHHDLIKYISQDKDHINSIHYIHIFHAFDN